jgi:dihydroorotate dehydrogenase subfamily 1
MFKILHKTVSGPFTIPSGIITTKTSVIEKFAREIPELGIITTKSIGRHPREGNKEPILAKYAPFSFVNAVGLANPGAEAFAAELSHITIPEDKFLLISIFGSEEAEIAEITEILKGYADGFELNVSCPHAEGYGQAVGQDKELVKRLTKTAVSSGKPVFIKISPNLPVEETVRYAVSGGASGITAINTRGPVEYLHDGHPVLSNKEGGISGKAILETGIECARRVRELTDLPIIACGGISAAQEVKRYREAGADFFGVGSALAGMDTETVKNYFHTLSLDLDKGTRKTESFLKEGLNMEYKKYSIEQKRRLAEDLFILEMDKEIRAKPGQFVFIWLPGKGEKPFSVFDDAPLSLLVKERGCFTKELAKTDAGDTVYIRGPYGNSPTVDGKTLLVGGGSGIAALYLFAKRNRGNTAAVLGAKNGEHLPWAEKFEEACRRTYLTTEDGNMGLHGLATDIIERAVEEFKPEYCINCGPESMVREALRMEKRHVNPQSIYSAIEFLTRCGTGLCGSCATASGNRSCVDGTFLRSGQL